jgi:UDP-N-acetylmuramoyl-tripeptide--D-alanyl-D-alanine ligase
MEPIALTWIAEALNARVIGALNGIARGICTDTRQGADGALFFALQGENTDGHNYVAQAFAAGAVGAVVSREIEGVKGPLLIVPDTLRALGDLANRYRQQFAIPVVGITGSVGKTSTKEMIAAVLRTKYRTLASDKNFNNEIGVPLTLFQLTKAHKAAVIEMGMRGLGEIDRLAEIAQPTVGVITQIGYAHIERLGSQQQIAQAKSELLARLPAGSFALLPYRDRFYDYLKSRVPTGCTVLSFGEGGEEAWPPDVRLYPVASRANGCAEARVMIYRQEFFLTLRAFGAHHLHNAGAALAAAYALDVPLKQAIAALEAWEGAPGRMVVRHTPDGLTILDDCYNAGPESMEAALQTLALETIVNGVAVLGDMKELGDFAPDAHRAVGQKVVAAQVKLLVTVGELAREIEAGAREYAAQIGRPMPPVRHFTGSEEAAAHIREIVTPKDTVLVKGSRAMQMEQIVAALTGEPTGDAHG